MVSCTKLEKEVEALRAYMAAGRKFIEKVESGRARSVETYNDFKACEQQAKAALETA